MILISTDVLRGWLDQLFSTFLCKDGWPIVKVHGFGLTTLKLLLRYPWYSVDSTSWVMESRNGRIYIPRKKDSKWVFDESPFMVDVSLRPGKGGNDYYFTLSPTTKKIVDDYVEEKGFVIGASEFFNIGVDHELKEDERLIGPQVNGKRRLCERIVSPGLCNQYMERDKLNIKYFLDLEKSIPEWPVQFGVKRRTGFGL
jgi:hypothetical protein